MRASRNIIGPLGLVLRECVNCKELLPLSEFTPRRDRPGCYLTHCIECSAEVARKAYAKNPERAGANAKRWRVAHSEQLSQIYHNTWVKNSGEIKSRTRRRYSENPAFRSRRLLGSFLYRVIKGYIKGQAYGTKKLSRIFDLFGCPAAWLEVHLESLFKPGMTWGNYGPVWHIDHAKPCADFDLANPEQQKTCFHWTNLQPLFVKENLKKSDLPT